jgi:arylsulfatase A-like enzyme
VLSDRLSRRQSVRRSPAVLAAVVMLLSALVPVAASAVPNGATNGSQRNTRPNVLLITTDDQTMSDLKYMPRTRRLIGAAGVTFDGISPHPLCCPARAEILTGQFAQNNGVRTNRGAYGGYRLLKRRNTISSWLNRAGYRTIFMGKYLNGYDRYSDNGAAPGWHDWNPTVAGVYEYRDFSVRHNTKVRHYRGRYQTDLFTDLAVRKIKGASQAKAPFFLWQSYVAPHGACPPSKETERCWVPPQVASRHKGMYRSATPPLMDTPVFNEVHNEDKPWPLRSLEPLDRAAQSKVVRLHRRRLESLQAVDEGISRMLGALKRTGELRNTLVIFTSDNGYLLGEHRYSGKVLPYEPALKVPLLMRGPGVPRGVVRHKVATTVDIAPTITAVAKANARLTMDGRNLMPVARGGDSWETLLIQAGPNRPRDEPYGWFYRGVRTKRYTYVEYPRGPAGPQTELYDRQVDPLQLDNLTYNQGTRDRYAEIIAELSRRTAILEGCAGRECRRSWPALPAPEPGSGGGSEPALPPVPPTAGS